MFEWLESKVGEHLSVTDFLRDERFVYQNGDVVRGEDPYLDNTFVWFHRDLREEAHVPGEMPIIYQDERIVVVDKPPFLSSIPRGKHVVESVVVRLRNSLGLPELTPAHRLDRLTSGVLVLTTEKKWRGAYQMLFQKQETEKTYAALAPTDKTIAFPATVKNHIHKVSGERSVRIIDDAEPNSHSIINVSHSLGDKTVYRLNPVTGKTHQLRQHMLTLGIPIEGDPIYPKVLPVDIDDFKTPLQLLASDLRFKDPITGKDTHFKSGRTLPIKSPLT